MTLSTDQMISPEICIERVRQVRDEIARSIIGMQREVELLLCAILAGRHVLVEGVPGLGKTTLIKTLAAVMGCSYRRIQFTPDLLPADILGGYVYNPRDGTFSLRRGPIFANVILGDEINRAPAKTQSAMLEVMQEGQVTIEGQTIPVDRPFFVFATQNPLEHEGVYPLPQAQLDRFALRLILTYPPAMDEQRMLAIHRAALHEPAPVLNASVILQAQETVSRIHASDEILALIVRLLNRTRMRDGVLMGASPRVGLDLLHLGRARALLDGREQIIPDDIKALFIDVANHRVSLLPEADIAGLTTTQVLHDALQSTNLV